MNGRSAPNQGDQNALSLLVNAAERDNQGRRDGGSGGLGGAGGAGGLDALRLRAAGFGGGDHGPSSVSLCKILYG